MGISQTTAAIMVFLTGLLPASCHKDTNSAKTSTEAQASAESKAAPQKFGEIILTNLTDTCLQLADGKNCILTPKLIDPKSVRITVALESQNQYGETSDYSVAQVVTRPGSPTEVAVGSLNFTFTPQIVAKSQKP
jgi:hypothetical protein